jgi:hypothetical protein
VGVAAPPVVVPPAGVAARRDRHSTTPGPGPSPCGRARPRVPPAFRRRPSRQRLPTTCLRCLPTACHQRLRPRPSTRPEDHHLDALVPAGWRMGPCIPCHRLQHHGDDPTPSDWVVDSELLTTQLPLQTRSLCPIPSIPPTPPRSSLATIPLCRSPQ